MTIEESRRSQRPYRYGMVLLCVGALINWLGLAENYVEPVRYVGVACIVAGALLICAAMCCWLHAPPSRTSSQTQRTTHPITAQVSFYLTLHPPPTAASRASGNATINLGGGASSLQPLLTQLCVLSPRLALAL
jgi:hypothetical protein